MLKIITTDYGYYADKQETQQSVKVDGKLYRVVNVSGGHTRCDVELEEIVKPG